MSKIGRYVKVIVANCKGYWARQRFNRRYSQDPQAARETANMALSEASAAELALSETL